ncbi:MAG: hypothetical protein HKO59_16415 [Phycisphaerales bacterium]|nr:hypothetical protein [Phycisphaerales bacterium]NNM27536.1 hypothetical protein [Phycisphaerales bacterium]
MGMIAKLRRRRVPFGTPPGETRPLTCEALGRALRRAMDLGLWEHADRIVETALRLAAPTDGLRAEIARVRIAQGRVIEALTIIEDATPPLDAELGLLRCRALILLGRTNEARRELARRVRSGVVPPEMSRLLALLEWELGDEHSASETLRRGLQHTEDANSVALLMLLAAQNDRTTEAEAWASRLEACSLACPDLARLERLRASLGLTALPAASPTVPQIATLAQELAAQETVIPALVTAQKIRRQRGVIDLLYHAIQRVVATVDAPSIALESLAELARLRGDDATALAWAQRGRAVNPMSASLTRLIATLDVDGTGGDDAIGPIGSIGPDAGGDDRKDKAA